MSKKFTNVNIAQRIAQQQKEQQQRSQTAVVIPKQALPVNTRFAILKVAKAKTKDGKSEGPPSLANPPSAWAKNTEATEKPSSGEKASNDEPSWGDESEEMDFSELLPGMGSDRNATPAPEPEIEIQLRPQRPMHHPQPAAKKAASTMPSPPVILLRRPPPAASEESAQTQDSGQLPAPPSSQPSSIGVQEQKQEPAGSIPLTECSTVPEQAEPAPVQGPKQPNATQLQEADVATEKVAQTSPQQSPGQGSVAEPSIPPPIAPQPTDEASNPDSPKIEPLQAPKESTLPSETVDDPPKSQTPVPMHSDPQQEEVEPIIAETPPPDTSSPQPASAPLSETSEACVSESHTDQVQEDGAAASQSPSPELIEIVPQVDPLFANGAIRIRPRPYMPPKGGGLLGSMPPTGAIPPAAPYFSVQNAPLLQQLQVDSPPLYSQQPYSDVYRGMADENAGFNPKYPFPLDLAAVGEGGSQSPTLTGVELLANVLSSAQNGQTGPGETLSPFRVVLRPARKLPDATPTPSQGTTQKMGQAGSKQTAVLTKQVDSAPYPEGADRQGPLQKPINGDAQAVSKKPQKQNKDAATPSGRPAMTETADKTQPRKQQDHGKESDAHANDSTVKRTYQESHRTWGRDEGRWDWDNGRHSERYDGGWRQGPDRWTRDRGAMNGTSREKGAQPGRVGNRNTNDRSPRERGAHDRETRGKGARGRGAGEKGARDGDFGTRDARDQDYRVRDGLRSRDWLDGSTAGGRKGKGNQGADSSPWQDDQRGDDRDFEPRVWKWQSNRSRPKQRDDARESPMGRGNDTRGNMFAQNEAYWERSPDREKTNVRDAEPRRGKGERGKGRGRDSRYVENPQEKPGPRQSNLQRNRAGHRQNNPLEGGANNPGSHSDEDVIEEGAPGRRRRANPNRDIARAENDQHEGGQRRQNRKPSDHRLVPNAVVGSVGDGSQRVGDDAGGNGLSRPKREPRQKRQQKTPGGNAARAITSGNTEENNSAVGNGHVDVESRKRNRGQGRWADRQEKESKSRDRGTVNNDKRSTEGNNLPEANLPPVEGDIAKPAGNPSEVSTAPPPAIKELADRGEAAQNVCTVSPTHPPPVGAEGSTSKPMINVDESPMPIPKETRAASSISAAPMTNPSSETSIGPSVASESKRSEKESLDNECPGITAKSSPEPSIPPSSPGVEPNGL